MTPELEAAVEKLEPTLVRREVVFAGDVAFGDRLLAAGGADDAFVPFRVSLILRDTDAGLLNITGERRVAVLRPSVLCVVEREVG